MTTWITICDTCKREGWENTAMEQTDGEVLATLIEATAEGTDIKTRRVSCLMGCERACNVAIQGKGKLAYTLGSFDPVQSAAEGIVAYAAEHAESTSGQVPYGKWPETIKGHFVTRHPPIEEIE